MGKVLTSKRSKEEEEDFDLNEEDKEEDIYSDKTEEKIENDEISSQEEAFMQGYKEA